ncbi:Uncharacterised protein [Raoultella terrigena]|uniref:Uncharacterized protein n=1 Tax=Raoultella terrigena TaxID=577 RepID=A0A4U9DC71_RAOTE|nr:Uncharacterised protein [Raoultella terrigena]
MRNKILVASALAATAVLFVAGCSSNQSLKTTDGRTIVPTASRRWIAIPAWSRTKMPQPAAPNRSIAIR